MRYSECCCYFNSSFPRRPQHGLSSGVEGLQSSNELWSQQAWPLDKHLLCLNRFDWRTGAQHAPEFTSPGRNGHYSSQTTTGFAHPGLKSQASQETVMPRTATWLGEAADEHLT